MPHTFSPFKSEQRMRGRKAPRGEEINLVGPVEPGPTSDLRCCLCGAVAKRYNSLRSGRRGYCNAHRDEANAEAKTLAGKLSVEAELNWKPMGSE